ncbi:MAG: hypothetical protein HQL46_10840 [Gammaproteobacteria bacterium]|nr:hypothetical protein [Gammaproteobacteria bacterium]
MKLLFSRFVLLLIPIFISACVSNQTPQTPKISHVHIGHAMTGWKTTPGKQGLFIIAEKEAKVAAEYSDLILQSKTLQSAKENAKHVLHAIDPKLAQASSGTGFGFAKALSEARDHIQYAATSPDTSENINNKSIIFSKHVDELLSKNALITDLGNEILASNNLGEALILAEELNSLVQLNLNGDSTQGELGMVQLREQIQKMIDNEVPAYHPVEERFLFGLVRLPSGIWKFLDNADANKSLKELYEAY